MTKQKFKLAVYLLLASVAVILLFVGTFLSEAGHPLRDVAYNLSAEILGAVVIFFVVDRLFSLGSDDDMAALRSTISDVLASYFWEYDDRRNISTSQFPLGELVPNAEELSILTYYGSALLHVHKDTIASAVRSGLRVRFISLADDAPVVNMIPKANRDLLIHKLRSECPTISAMVTTPQDPTVKGSFQVRKIKWLPSTSIIIVRLRDGETRVKVGINPVTPEMPYGDTTRQRGRPCLAFSSQTHKYEIDYFTRHFEYLWQSTSECDVQQPM